MTLTEKCSGTHHLFVAEKTVTGDENGMVLSIFLVCTGCGADLRVDQPLKGLVVATTTSDLKDSTTIN